MSAPSLSDRIRNTSVLEKSHLITLVQNAMDYYRKSWQDVSEDCGFFGELDPALYNMRDIGHSSPVIEYVIRPHVQILVCAAVLLDAEKNGTAHSEIGADLKKYLNRGIRWACRTHLTGDQDIETFLLRKRWGENWNSALWASILAVAATIGKDHIESELMDDVRRVLAFEADRFTDTLPPNGRRGDSMADETAKDTMLLSWAQILFPDHPNVSVWRETLKTYALNIASTVYDHTEFHELDGRNIASYISTVTIHPDYTLESHGFFHPEFLSYTQWVMGALLPFLINGREAPACLVRPTHDKVSQLFLNCCLSNGYPWPVGGQDWPLWKLKPYSFAYSMWRGDRIALKTLLNLLSLLAEFHEQNGDGRFIPGMPFATGGWGLLHESQIAFELSMLYATPFAEDLMVPIPGRFEKSQDVNEKFGYVQTLIRRNSKTLRSFTWNNMYGRPTGSIVAQSNPLLAGISADSLVGSIHLEDTKLTPVTLFHQEQRFREGFETFGKICYFNPERENMLERQIRVFTWGDEGLLILDRLTAAREVTLEKEEACPLYIMNDELNGNSINIVAGSLEESIPGPGGSAIDHKMPNNWVVVEDTMLYQLVWGMEKSIVYRDETERMHPPYWKNLRMDKVFINTRPGLYQQGELIREFGLYVGLGKGQRWFKVNGKAGDFCKGLIVMEGKNTLAL